jgi:hypothetical protein
LEINDMKSLFRPAALLVLALPLVLAACGDKEPEQRAAFSQFLQTRILDKAGLRVPQLTADESKAFGDYSTHYAVITDFSTSMDNSVQPLGELVKKGSMRSLDDVVARRDEIRAIQTGLGDIATQLTQEQAKADAAHAQLKQPEDLKAVYDKAYDKTVSVPAQTFREVLPQLAATFDSSLKVADYVTAHKAQIQISGSMLTVSDPKVQAELNRLLQDLGEQGKKAQQAQVRLQKLKFGR